MHKMAAASHAATAELVELRTLQVQDMEAVLDDQRVTWQSLLRWDFTASAELVRRFVRIRALSGYALMFDGAVAGYSYYVCEDRKGLIGDLFLRRRYATTENEDLLLGGVLDDLVRTSSLDRIEAQLMLLRGPSERGIPLGAYAHAYPRVFMVAELDSVRQLPASSAPVRIAPWQDGRQDEAALIIAAAYTDHVDADINDQYRSYAGAKRFLHNIVQYPGCGAFFAEGSFLAEQPDGRACGLVLSSRVAPDVGHITQVCLTPEWKARGAGYELMRSALTALARSGCERASLTVTASNSVAIGLYQRLGFRAIRRFAAYVWEGF
jgi:ribosomal protein S18 acetylase RimI-like enzyme